MEIIKPKICLTIEEAEEIRNVLWRLSSDGRGAYEVSSKDCDQAEAIANRLHDIIIQND